MTSSAIDTSTDAPVWRTPAGTVHGWRDGPVLRATGIRYATAEEQ